MSVTSCLVPAAACSVPASVSARWIPTLEPRSTDLFSFRLYPLLRARDDLPPSWRTSRFGTFIWNSFRLGVLETSERWSAGAMNPIQESRSQNLLTSKTCGLWSLKLVKVLPDGLNRAGILPVGHLGPLGFWIRVALPDSLEQSMSPWATTTL